MKTMLETMIEGKGIDIDKDLNIEGQINLTTRTVLEFIYQMPTDIQKKVAKTFIQIDFKNGDIMHYIEYLANGMAKGF